MAVLNTKEVTLFLKQKGKKMKDKSNFLSLQCIDAQIFVNCFPYGYNLNILSYNKPMKHHRKIVEKEPGESFRIFFISFAWDNPRGYHRFSGNS